MTINVSLYWMLSSPRGGDGYDSKLFSGYEIGNFNSQNLETTMAFIVLFEESVKGLFPLRLRRYP